MVLFLNIVIEWSSMPSSHRVYIILERHIEIGQSRVRIANYYKDWGLKSSSYKTTRRMKAPLSTGFHFMLYFNGQKYVYMACFTSASIIGCTSFPSPPKY